MNAPLHGFDPDSGLGREPRLDVEDGDGATTDLLSGVSRLAGIVRRRWLVVLASVLVCVAGSAVAIKLLQPRWRSSATILLHTSGLQVLDKVQGVGEDEDDRRAGYRDYYETQLQIMGSRAVAERALAALGLAHDPVFLGIGRAGTEAEAVARAAVVDPVERLRDLVSVAEVRNSRIVRLSAEYPDAQVSAEIVNAVADAYVEYVDTGRSRAGVDAQTDIAKEKTNAHVRLQAAERAFESFKQDNELSSIDQLAAHATQGISSLNGHSKDLEAERIRLESMVMEAKRLNDKGNISAVNLLSEGERVLFGTMRSERLEAERVYGEIDVKFGPKHEEHRKAKRRVTLAEQKVQRERADLIETLEARLNVARTTEKRINGSLRREKARALHVTDLEREYRSLERDAVAAADEYLLIARRDVEIAVTNRVEDQGIEILDRATTPSRAVFPKKVMLLLLGVAAGLGAGVLLALSVDFRDQRIRDVTDMERTVGTFGLPVLGQLPRLPADKRLGAGDARGQRRQRDLYAHLFPQSLMAERCRGVRTSLAFGAAGETLRSLMVTSPSSSEGKSSIALNLALSFCQANQRVVLIDADLRRPRLHQVFPEAADAGDKGLSALLEERCTIDDALVRSLEDAPSNLSVLPCGAIPDNPAELVGTPVFRRLLVELQSYCDLVIIDCPPVLPVTDPTIVARHVDGVAVVGRSGSTTRGELQRTIAQLARGDTNVLGVILNEVDTRTERYGYSRDYYTYRANNGGGEQRVEPA